METISSIFFSLFNGWPSGRALCLWLKRPPLGDLHSATVVDKSRAACDLTWSGCHLQRMSLSWEGVTPQKVLLHLWWVAADSAWPDPCLLPSALHWRSSSVQSQKTLSTDTRGMSSHGAPLWMHTKPPNPPPNQDRTPNQAPLFDHSVHPQIAFLCMCGVIHLNSQTTVWVGVHSVFCGRVKLL